MCGILGQINLKKNLSADEIQKLKSSLNMLDHRGPNATGIFLKKKVFLGHKRLSIIDTSRKANQPMKFKDKVIVFNGEIYNFLDLKTKLISKGYKFSTNSDTEVLLKGYDCWKERLTDMLDGMWAFCIFNEKTGEAFLSRDSIGQKPLYYFASDEKFVFSSEIPAILNLLNFDEKEIDFEALTLFNLYNFRHIPAPFTPFKKIKKLIPGYNLYFKNKILLKKYIKLNKVKIKNPVEQLDDILNSEVNKITISDVPVGIFLSGGVDSAIIAAKLANKKLVTYSLGFDKNDPEIIRSKKIADELNLKNKQVFFKGSNTQVNLMQHIKQSIKQYGEPIYLFQILYSDLILQQMKKDKVVVAICGNGGDELFYGYDGINKLKLISDIKKIIDTLHLNWIFPKIGFFPRLLCLKNSEIKNEIYIKKLKEKTYIKDKYKKDLLKDLFEEYSAEISSKELIDVFNWLGLRIENEHSITVIADLSGMRRSMEIRTPFLNKAMLDFATSLPNKYKVRSYFFKKKNKYVLKKVLEKYLPKKLIYAKKMGFGYGIKFYDFIHKNKNVFEYYINKVVPNIPFYDIHEIKRLLKEHLQNKKDNSKALIEILIMSIWFELFAKHAK